MIPIEHLNVGKPIDIYYEDPLSVNTRSYPMRDKKKSKLDGAKATSYLWHMRQIIAERNQRGNLYT